MNLVTAGAPIIMDVSRLFLLGHSAGATHIITMALLPEYLPDDISSRIRGMVILGGVYHFRSNISWEPFADITQYYGTESEIHEREPLSLLERVTERTWKLIPPLLLAAEKEPESLTWRLTLY